MATTNDGYHNQEMHDGTEQNAVQAAQSSRLVPAWSYRAADPPKLVESVESVVAGVADLLMAGEVSAVGGTAMVVPRNRFLRATVRAGSEGVAGAPTSAVTVHGAAIHGPVLVTRRDLLRDRGDWP